MSTLLTDDAPKWVYVRRRFRQFLENMRLTDDQITDGRTKALGVQACLDNVYYGGPQNGASTLLVGSWAKGTAVRPPRDVDFYFILPDTVYQRFALYAGNRQSALLQEVKRALQAKYPTTTDIRGDGPVVYVGFQTFRVEVVPAFELNSGQFFICDTKSGGRYKVADPRAEITHVQAADARNAKNVTSLIHMLKAWQAWCEVPLKSFYLELLAIEYVDQSEWRLNDALWHDWLTRDFFAWLINKAHQLIFVPGTNEPVYLGDAWKTRAETAHARAIKACNFERDNRMLDAGDEWQKIFGLQIPRTVL